MKQLTRGLLRGLDERPVEAPLTDRDLSEHQDMSVKHPFMFTDMFVIFDKHTSSVREFTRNELHQLIMLFICMLYNVLLDIFFDHLVIV